MSKLLADAQKGDYAVGSFSVANMEMVLGVLKAAKELKKAQKAVAKKAKVEAKATEKAQKEKAKEIASYAKLVKKGIIRVLNIIPLTQISLIRFWIRWLKNLNKDAS